MDKEFCIFRRLFKLGCMKSSCLVKNSTTNLGRLLCHGLLSILYSIWSVRGEQSTRYRVI